MGQLEDMALFVRIVEAGGIGKAAEQLNMAKSVVSRRLSQLEQQLQAQLMHRNTRTWRLSEAGKTYYQQALNILADVAQLQSSVSGDPATLTGQLKISAPLAFGMQHLNPIIASFCQQHPALHVQVDLTDRHVDLVEEGYELAVRISDLQDSSLRARKITVVRHCLAASPDYLDRHGEPDTPEDLIEHDFLRYNLSPNNKLKLHSARGRAVSAAVRGTMSSNNGDLLKDMAIRGRGIICLPTFLVYDALTDGRLKRLLPDWHFADMYMYIVYPNGRFLSQRARAFIDHVASQCPMDPFWDQDIH